MMYTIVIDKESSEELPDFGNTDRDLKLRPFQIKECDFWPNEHQRHKLGYCPYAIVKSSEAGILG